MKKTFSYLVMKQISFQQIIDEYISNDAPAEAINLVNAAWHNYEIFEPLEDGSYDMAGLEGESNEQALDTMHNYGGYTWSLLYAADFIYRSTANYTREQLVAELNKITAFENYAESLDFIDTSIASSLIPEMNKEVSEYGRLKNGYYLVRRLSEIDFHNSLSWVSGRYFQYREFLRAWITGLSPEMTTKRLAYLFFYKQQGDYMTRFDGDKIKIFKELSAQYGKGGFKHLQTHYNHCAVKYNRQEGRKKNIDDLKFVRKLLATYHKSIGFIDADLIVAEQNFMKTEGGKRKC